jgi:hypothetical protein
MLANCRRWRDAPEAWLFAAGDTRRRLIAKKQFTRGVEILNGRPVLGSDIFALVFDLGPEVQ